MSKHSKNNTSSNVFTYGERKMLEGIYGTLKTRVGDDTQKKFDKCCICLYEVRDPLACSKGHLFCKQCIYESILKQKEKAKLLMKEKKEVQIRKKQKQLKKEAEDKEQQIAKFQKNQLLSDIRRINIQQLKQIIKKPLGTYQVKNQEKHQLCQTSFWTKQINYQPQQNIQLKKNLQCPFNKHPIKIKKLRKICLLKVHDYHICYLCKKEIAKQKIGCWNCGHVICLNCRSNKCQICNKDKDWLQLDSTGTAYSQNGKAHSQVYTHAFIC